MSSIEAEKIILEKMHVAYNIISECESLCPEIINDYKKRMENKNYVASKEEVECFECISEIDTKIKKHLHDIYSSVKKYVRPLEGEVVKLKSGKPIFTYLGTPVMDGAALAGLQLYSEEEGKPFLTVSFPSGKQNSVRIVDVDSVSVCDDESTRKKVFRSLQDAQFSN